MTDCLFCKIIEGTIPSAKIYEDDVVYAFLDISQTTQGHTLVIPKQHTSDIFEYSEDLASQVCARIPKIARAIEQAFPEMQGLNILSNNREAAYQTVFHSHWHLIPRYHAEDGFSIQFTNRMEEFSSSQLQEIAQKIADQFN